jgi:hypothetical protein
MPAMPRQSRRLRPRFTPAAAAVAACLLGACVAEKKSPPPVRPPAELRPDSLAIAAYPLLDDDANGYPDTLPLVVYIWDNRYPLPMWAEGTMHFELRDEDDRLIAEWDVPAEVVAASRRRDQVGAAHAFTLDIREATTDVRPLTNARLSGAFIGEDGATAKTARPLGIQIGA